MGSTWETSKRQCSFENRGEFDTKGVRKGKRLIRNHKITWIIVVQHSCYISTVGSRFTTGLRSRIFGCKSNRRKTSTI
jgi:hypothetical protein